RNLGFEDTPDYDYLRELFTQALHNAGDVEDGEYDWDKVTTESGKGWDSGKHGAGYLHNPNARPGPSQMELHGSRHMAASSPHQQAQNLTVGRLNAAQPPPPSPIKQLSKQRDRSNVPGGIPPPMGNGAGGHHGMPTPNGSTQAQFQHSS